MTKRMSRALQWLGTHPWSWLRPTSHLLMGSLPDLLQLPYVGNFWIIGQYLMIYANILLAIIIKNYKKKSGDHKTAFAILAMVCLLEAGSSPWIGLNRDIEIDTTFSMVLPFTLCQDMVDSIIKSRIYWRLLSKSPLKRIQIARFPLYPCSNQ